ncbi:dimethylamine monooxygenase subunit DmmA family protein [Oceanobacter mangrovi]|uniref:dimethylamine monooxygenase subunit DmmA family protein n=1 Tax=Oceanobacter mangrovi TaxID=2862510 RepID=UPI001C8DB689|nr:dimethylamine monooxygenase subunit DmmA family protein [Oceanobacter mangrovi]
MTTPVEIDDRVKSRPQYGPVKLQTSQQQQVFVSADANSATLQQMFDECTDIVGPDRCLWLTISADKATMATELATATAALPVATAIYVSGDESYMWDVRNTLIRLGFAPEQIQMLAPLSTARRLFCTHCYTVMEGVTHTPHKCEGCGELLLVRDHFSTLMGSYVGVSINAEDPSEIPAPEALS